MLDGQRLVAEAIGVLLAEVMGLELLAICDRPGCVHEAFSRSPADLLVMDPCGSGDDWISVVEAMYASNPAAQVVLRRMDDTVFSRCPALTHCTFATLEQTSGWSDLLDVLQAWKQQSHVLPEGSNSRPCLPQLLGIDRLPQREQRLVLELGRGLLSKQISQNLALTPATVGTYRKTIAAKLGVSGPELVRIAALYRCWHSARASGVLPGC